MARPADLPDARVLGAEKPHGTRLRYMAGCRCLPCRAANSNYETSRAVARKSGDWDGLVSAERSRRHIKSLSAAGVGRRAISKASGVSKTVLQEVKSGRKKQIRARTERRILAVSKASALPGSTIDPRDTWNKLNRLIHEGFTRSELARRLGSDAKHAALQISKNAVLARTARKVNIFYRTIMAGA